MRYILLSLGILLLQVSIINGQDWQWGQQFKSSGNVYPTSIASDNNDNVYVAGRFDSGDLTIGTAVHTHLGDWDVFVSSFASDGIYRWSTTIAGVGRDDIGTITVDQNNILYIVGSFRNDAVYFTPTDSLENSDNYDAFLAAYDANGNFLFANRIFWGTSTEKLRGITINENQSKLAVAGNFKTELVYNDGVSDITVAAVGGKDQFVAEFDLSGNFQDIAVFTVTKQQTTLTNISICNDGGYFVGGDLRERINFSPTEFLLGDAVNMDAMVFRLDENLNYLWGRLGKGPDFDHVNSSTSDVYSNVYMVGKVQSQPVVFDSTDTQNSAPLYGSSGGDIDMYVAKYNRTGVLQWVRRIGSSGDDNAYGVNLFENQVQFAGNYAGQIIINQDTLDSGSASNINTGFFAYDFDGNAVAGEEILGDISDRGRDLVLSVNGKTLVTGEFSSTSIIAGPITLTNTNSPLFDGFLFKYGYDFTASISQTEQITCNGESDGELVVLPNYGVPPYNYSWTGPDGFTETNDTVSGLKAGMYTVIVTDAINATVEVEETINEPDAITITSSATDVSCFDSNNGTILLTISGGTVSSDYTYLWSSDDGSGLTQGVKDQVGLSIGTYSVIVTDDNGCTANDSFIITQPLPFSFAGSVVDDIITPPGGNGGVNLIVTNAIAPLTYSWTGPGGFSSNASNLSNLSTGGNYTVVVTDANMCSGDTTFFVNDAAAFLAYISDQTNVSCLGGTDGSLTVTPSGGAVPYSFDWRDEFANQVGTDSILLDVPAGNYFVRVDESGGENVIVSAVITEPPTGLQVLSNITDIICAGNTNGAIDIIVSGGTVPYTYAWIGPNGFTATSEDISNLEAGDYSVTVTDANGCTSVLADLTVSEPLPLSLTIDINSDVLCNGEFGGELEAIVAGGTAPYSYLWNDQGNQTTKRATTLPAGFYSVIVTDANGCTIQANQFLTEPDAISVSVLKQDVSCGGEADGFISLTVLGGTAPFSYLWSPINEITKDITDLSGGDYTVNITDANNCTWDTTITILEAPAIIINLVTVTDVTGCYGSDNGSIEVDATGGLDPLEYSFDDGASWQASNILADIGGGTYPISVRDANSCLFVGSPVTVNEPEAIVFSTLSVNISCYGLADGSIEIVVASGGIAPFEYSIDGGVTYQAESNFSNLSAADYDVIVKGADACESPGSTVTVTEPLEIVILSGVTTPTCLGESSGSVVVTAEGGTGALNYVLKQNGSEIASNSDGNFTGLEVGTYIVEVSDENDCGPTSSSTLEVEQSPTNNCAVDIYNAFSPNNDGINDYWNIYRIENYPNAVVKVYNNWGTIVFTSTAGYPTPWDGSYNGSALPAGTYYYVIDLDNGAEPKSGTVNIIK